MDGQHGVSAASVYEARACACFFMFPHVASPLATESPTAKTNVALLGTGQGHGNRDHNRTGRYRSCAHCTARSI
jgi:hypothetical protein